MAKSSLAAALWLYAQRNRPPDPAADAEREAMILSQLPVVERLAREHHRSFHFADHNDLYQAGCVGLVEAADRYRPRVARGFAPFAYFRINGAIIDAHKRKNFRESINKSIQSMADPSDGWVPACVDTCPAPLPDAILERKQLLAKLAGVVRSLPKQDADLIRAWAEGANLRQQCKISGLNQFYTRKRIEELITGIRAAVYEPPKTIRIIFRRSCGPESEQSIADKWNLTEDQARAKVMMESNRGTAQRTSLTRRTFVVGTKAPGRLLDLKLGSNGFRKG